MLIFDFDSGWDLLLKTSHGQQVLSAEVRGWENISQEWATQFRRNLFTYEKFPLTPYFLFAMPDRFYLWTSIASQEAFNPPDHIIDAKSIVLPYLNRSSVQLKIQSKDELVLILMSWFSIIMQPEAYTEGQLSEHQWLIDSGLYTAFVSQVTTREVAV